MIFQHVVFLVFESAEIRRKSALSTANVESLNWNVQNINAN